MIQQQPCCHVQDVLLITEQAGKLRSSAGIHVHRHVSLSANNDSELI